MPDHESSQERRAWSARSYEGIEHPVKFTVYVNRPKRAGHSWLTIYVPGFEAARRPWPSAPPRVMRFKSKRREAAA
jgi:hypothetical protein